MGLLLQIGLTIAAIRSGWKKSIALIPLGTCLLAGMLIGLAVSASGGSVEEVLPVCLLLDLLSFVALGVMIARAPNRKKAVSQKQGIALEAVQTNVKT